jgi:malyl-CoA/(S)-citramalyl-CoA lyase
MIPKVEGPWDIQYVDRLLAQLEAKHRVTRPILLHAILETAQGVTHVEEICAASPRVQGVSFGPADLAASRRMKTTRVGGGHPAYLVRSDPDPKNPTRRDKPTRPQAIARMATRAPPCPSTAVRHRRRSAADQLRAVRSAASALVVTSQPDRDRQKVFSPPVEGARAKKVLEAIPDGAASMIDGKMQDDATRKQCKVMVSLAQLLAAMTGLTAYGRVAQAASAAPGGGAARECLPRAKADGA